MILKYWIVLEALEVIHAGSSNKIGALKLKPHKKPISGKAKKEIITLSSFLNLHLTISKYLRVTWTLIRENQLTIKCSRNLFELSKSNDSLQMFPFHEKDPSSRISKNGIVMERGLQGYFRKKKSPNQKKKTPPHSFLETDSTLQEIFLFCIETLC